MITKRIFVGGLENAEAAAQLQLDEADSVALCLSPLRWNPLVPNMSHGEALKARDQLANGGICFCLDPAVSLEEQLVRAREFKPEYYLADVRDPWPDDSIEALQKHGYQLILSGFTLDSDDDASAVADSMKECAATWNPLLFQLTLTPSRHSPVQWFRDEAGEYDDDATLDDLQRLVNTYPVLLNAAIDAAGGGWLEQQLPTLKGWFFWNGRSNEEARTPVTSTWDVLMDLIGSRRRG